MPQVQNSDAIKAIRDGARLSISEGFPQMLSNTIVPVMDMTPDFHRRATISKNSIGTTTGAISVYTTAANKDFYLTGLNMSFIKDVICDTAGMSLTVTTEGINKTIFGFPTITLTAQTANLSHDFTVPIKIDPNTVISLSGTFTAGVLVRNISIFGFEVIP